MWYYYIRMSHRTSAASGLSEQAQFKVIDEFRRVISVHTEMGKCKFPNDAQPGCFVDRGVSGWNRNLEQRPAGKLLLETVKSGDTIVFYNVERAFRNTEQFLRAMRKFYENGVTVHFACEQFDFTTASGKLMCSVMAAVAAYQSDLTSERTKEALAIKRLQGTAGSKKPKVEWIDSECKLTTPGQVNQRELAVGAIRIYNRVSSLDQELSGLSMEHQRQANIDRANRLKVVFPNLSEPVVYEDQSVSAYRIPFNKRPAASRLLADLKKGDHVIVYRADRAFRNTRQSCEFVEDCHKMGVTVHLTRDGLSSGDEFGRMFFNMLSMFAEIESAIKSRRKLEINEYLAAHGRPIARLPIQYTTKKVNGKKQMKHDMARLRRMACCWIARQMGISFDNIHGIMYAYDCMDKGMKPTLKQHDYIVEKWNVRRFEEIKDDLPVELVRELIAHARGYLSRDIEDMYTYWCRYPLPLDCTEGHLIACEIAPELLGLTPNPSCTASAPA